MSPLLAARDVVRSFGATRALDGACFALDAGEVVAIMGPSGSGKSTLLHCLAGILPPDAGSVRFDGRELTAMSDRERSALRRRDFGFVFQFGQLVPELDCRENAALPLRLEGVRRREAERRATAWLERLEVADLAGKRPGEISGGEGQRVAVARALATEPRILLLDEPLGALDALTRAGLQVEIARIFERDRRSAVLVTNDVDEAILLADRIVPLVPGADGARLGASFRVALARPRDRAALNHDPSFKKLRNEVTAHLLELAARRSGPRAGRAATPLPPLGPVALPPRRRGAGS
jgi:putative ABC transport system ATP-binding protein